jgi:hypothetical protein
MRDLRKAFPDCLTRGGPINLFSTNCSIDQSVGGKPFLWEPKWEGGFQAWSQQVTDCVDGSRG